MKIRYVEQETGLTETRIPEFFGYYARNKSDSLKSNLQK
ncbi:hypothetical protein LEP1GSC058_2294 [Leptospira fainei serovar Hurstbridge str. BUT 6]|uniref:Uncharacterized protein n=1 Tax=Leptospira fainei serovar Hurstbridge str. BUT 6 TaxID=1193011 RepID=S3V3S3_9LEPT|nr:hypothetical protein LEP1GSC058_2294 [Leptospira fainei serovar Hurstbridge str. BUT 6]